MNSRQRRKRSRSHKGITVFSQSDKPRKTKAKPKRRLPHILTAGRVLWAIVVAGATLLAYVVLKPNIAIEPYASQDPRRPFAEQFYIQNNSIYEIHEIVPACGPMNTQINGVTMRDFSVLDFTAITPSLASGDKTTVTCSIDRLFASPQTYGNLAIIVWAKYKLPFNIPGCHASIFAGIPASDGSYVWTYRGSILCEKLNKPLFPK
jgi:hypothetical protein